MAQGGNIGSGFRVGFSPPGSSSPLGWSRLEQVMDITIPTLTGAKIDTTISSNVTKFMKSIRGLITVADLSVKMLRDNSSLTSPQQNELFALLASGVTLTWRIEIPASTDPNVNSFEAFQFDGIVASFQPGAPLAGAQTVVAMILNAGTYFSRYEPAPSLIGFP